ncbi:hypothetical protein ACLOJK_021184 [Asimina triloba]
MVVREKWKRGINEGAERVWEEASGRGKHWGRVSGHLAGDAKGAVGCRVIEEMTQGRARRLMEKATIGIREGRQCGRRLEGGVGVENLVGGVRVVGSGLLGCGRRQQLMRARWDRGGGHIGAESLAGGVMGAPISWDVENGCGGERQGCREEEEMGSSRGYSQGFGDFTAGPIL